MNQMSVARANQNRSMIKTKGVRYPFLHRQECKGLIRPEEFERAFPAIMFCRIPVHRDVYWLFETALDMDLFKVWERARGEDTE